MPHSKKDAKMDRKDKLGETIPEICDLKNCNNCVYLEMRKKQDLYMWVAKMPAGPSAKFLVENIHTLEELKLTGNCLKGSRPLLSFDASFDASPECVGGRVSFGFWSIPFRRSFSCSCVGCS